MVDTHSYMLSPLGPALKSNENNLLNKPMQKPHNVSVQHPFLTSEDTQTLTTIVIVYVIVIGHQGKTWEDGA